MDSDHASGHTARTWSGQAHRLPVDADQFRSLLNYVEEMIAMRGCDNTLAHAETWARAHDVGWARLSRTLRALGGFCDCEIGLNVVQETEDADDE